MGNIFRIRVVSILFLMGTMAWASSCEPRPDEPEEDRLHEYDEWVRIQTERADEVDDQDWERIRARHEDWVHELEPRREEWDDERRRRFDETRAQFEDTDRWRTEQMEEARRIEQREEAQRELLGEYTRVEELNARNIRDAYRNFIDTVREQRDEWTEEDWEQADRVLERLDERREELDLQTGDATQIIAWRAEYNTMRSFN